jgi:2-hydroxy-3-keto-5-methylthiopentenyl-1-phosphate phosphatase
MELSTRPLAVACDFDGTITLQDTAWAMLHVFAAPGWKRWSDEYAAGRITDQESMTRQFTMVATPISELTAWALANAQIRPGIRELTTWCAARTVSLTIVSNGLDFYLEPILQAHGIGADEVLCGRAAQGPEGIEVSYAHLWDAAYPEERDQKRLAVRRLHARGYSVVYIGDHDPDFRAAVEADLVFARDQLLERCGAAGIACYPFETFADVVAILDSKLRRRM